MSATITRLAKKRGRVPALVTAAGMAALLLLQGVLSSLAGWISAQLYARVSFGAESFDPSPWSFGSLLDPFLQSTLPFAIGVFISLWLIAPIAAELTLPFVITRTLLASAAGALLVLIVAVVVDLVAFLRLGFDIHGFAHSVIVAISQGVGIFITTTPVVVLAGVLLWLWLRDHPREYAVSGLIDEI